jgi:hypothetical protein
MHPATALLLCAVFPAGGAFVHAGRRHRSPASPASQAEAGNSEEGDDGWEVPFDSLLEMDVVVFSRLRPVSGLGEGGGGGGGGGDPPPASPPLELGALQEDWTLAPLSAWSLDEEGTGSGGGPGSIEFLVDEERRFPGLGPDDVRVHAVLEDGLVDYGTRQVGGGKGPGNPHGEESELVYYVARTAVEGEYCGRGRAIEVDLNPDLETLW